MSKLLSFDRNEWRPIPLLWRAAVTETMVTTPNDLSDKALAIFAFAAFHQLESGEAITSIVANDAAGHRADPEAVAELESRDLGALSGERFVFNVAGQLMLTQIIDRIRGTI